MLLNIWDPSWILLFIWSKVWRLDLESSGGTVKLWIWNETQHWFLPPYGVGKVAGVCCSWEALTPYRNHHRQHPPVGCSCAGLCCVPWHWWHVLGHGTGVQSNASASTHFISCFGLMGNADALCYHKKHWIYSFDRFLASEVMRDLKCLLWATKGWGFLFVLHFFCVAVAVSLAEFSAHLK